MEEQKPRGGAASFCIPKAALGALLDARADAVTIGAYLTLACFTDATGVYSTAALRAVRDYMSLNQDRGRRALEALQSIKAGKGKAAVALVYSRDAWLEKNGGEALPDGPTQRAQVRFVLPDFAEPIADRVWFSSALVYGFGAVKKPLQLLKHAGDLAARLLLVMQQATDMVGFGGMPPRAGLWQRYEIVEGGDNAISNSRLIISQDMGSVASRAVTDAIAGTGGDSEKTFDALGALLGSGLFYEVVLVLDRAPTPRKFANGDPYGDVPEDANPIYELDARSLHGFKPEGEIGLAGLTARTAGELGHAVTTGSLGEPDDPDHALAITGYRPGTFTGKYAAIVPRGYGAMIVGCFRPRFRVSNPRNAGVKDAWTRIYEGNRIGFEWIAALRMARGLAPIQKPGWLEPKATEQAPPALETGRPATRSEASP